MTTEEPTSRSAAILYRPLGLVVSLLSGVAASTVFRQVWKHATPGENADAPQPLESEYQWGEILVAAAVQGLVFGLVKAVVKRGGARAFQKWTGEWPGD